MKKTFMLFLFFLNLAPVFFTQAVYAEGMGEESESYVAIIVYHDYDGEGEEIQKMIDMLLDDIDGDGISDMIYLMYDDDGDGIPNYSDEDWLNDRGLSTFTGSPTQSPIPGDHSLDRNKLPTNPTTDVQMRNFCVFDVMVKSSRFLDNTKSQAEILLWRAQNGQPNVALQGFQGTWDELDQLLNHFFNTNRCETNIEVMNSIDNGHPVIAFIFDPPGTDQNGHAVMVTGYNNDGTFVYFDPQIGRYVNNVNYTLLIHAVEITSVK